MPERPSGWAFESRVDPSELQFGHFVTRLDIPWSETQFPLQGVLIDSADKKRWMQENCAWVVISREHSPNQWMPTSRLPAAPDSSSPRRLRASRSGKGKILEGEVNAETLNRALEIHNSLDSRIRDLAEQFRAGSEVDVDSAQSVVSELASVLEEHAAALVWLTRIKTRDDYTAQHCINASILSLGLAHALDWEEKKIEYAGLAGLLHDLGKLRIESEILNKPGPLTAEEYEIIKTHTTIGYQLLQEEGGLPDAVVQAVLHHHERPDGRGYPQGLAGGAIPQLARLVGIVDAYDAITSRRVYDPARSHHDAFSVLWKQRNQQFDGPMVEAFTHYLGWVTPGTLVRLSNGRLALVLQTGEGRGLLPMVRLLEITDAGHRLGDTLDLASQRPEVGDAPVRIAEVLPDGTEDVNIRELSRAFDSSPDLA
ncbi:MULTISPECIES: HD-GYP domain-containing protein [unclassified Wenzhouxiangella]|uniref:HD-GYP domain-containing protein n=1 Tax=unclassified Wenzhouxiangella TaxID=2613841 RepID=UPI000E326143|nr:MULTISPECIES: HD-GYP domain-containing protein [unclassified Wenzhouxiangella]RFF27706.1 HD-GYP domain-containing protein [Wenzhouxiangella sp. 15181]RFP69797.1 HD-GYP domain-containing protein [Wenzhouxiangella sp. 15190]